MHNFEAKINSSFCCLFQNSPLGFVCKQEKSKNIYFLLYSSDTPLKVKQHDVLDEPKYIIFKSCLLELFERCPTCSTTCKASLSRPMGGTLIVVKQVCRQSKCGFTRTWRSQPMIGNVSAGNLLLSGAILTSGCTPKKFLRALSSFNVANISYSTFFNHQSWWVRCSQLIFILLYITDPKCTVQIGCLEMRLITVSTSNCNFALNCIIH